jgi:hypothetical protein
MMVLVGRHHNMSECILTTRRNFLKVVCAYFGDIFQINSRLSSFRGVYKISESQMFVFIKSVPTEQLRSHWTDTHKIWHVGVFRKSTENIQI